MFFCLQLNSHRGKRHFYYLILPSHIFCLYLTVKKNIRRFFNLTKMKILTVATKEEGYFGLLRQTAGELGYTLEVLGWNEKWQGFHRKIIWYAEALAGIPADEAVVCVDGYDVVVVGPAEEMHKNFIKMNAPIVFSGQRYFPSRKWMRHLADKVMSNRKKNTIGTSNQIFDYSRPCTGLFAGYAGALHGLFLQLTELNHKEHINDDQVLLNIYYLRHPGSIILDSRCELFQNLWRTERGLYGSISPASKNSEIDSVR